MEVTKDNFQSLLPDIKKSIDEASFLAIDGEFTGLNDGGPRANPFDTPAQYFDKIRNGCSEFLLIQFGLCVFKYNQTLKRFTHTAYNFYIFPCPINRDVPDFRFRCQSSSLNFLASNNFDFNKLFKSGIPFLTHDAEQELLKDIEEREKQLNSSNLPNRPSETPIKIPDDLKENVDSACKKIQSLIDKGKPGDSIEIEEPNGFARKLIYQAVDKNFSADPIIMESKKQPNRTISLIVTKGASRQELERIKSMKALEEMKARLKETVGFSAVIRLISESGKLVVGHNMFLDIFYTISQFCTPLQSGYEAFKEITHFTLPKVIDTKVMCSLAPLKEKIRSSVLPHLLETIQTEPFEMQQIAMDKEGSGYALKDVKEHEAGYDAFMTGVCFLALYDHLNSLKKLDALNYSSSYISNAPALKEFINKVYLMRRFDAPYINLGGKDPVLFRRNVFHVDFPKEWATSDLISLFKPYGDVDVVWCNSTSAWVSLYDKSNNTIQKVIKNLVNCTEPKNYTVRTFAQHQDSLESMPLPVTNPSPSMGFRKRKLLEMASPYAGNSAKTPKMEPTTTNESELVLLHLSRLQVLFISTGLKQEYRYSWELMNFFEEIHNEILIKKHSGKDHPEGIYEYRMHGVPVLGFFILMEVCKSGLLQEDTAPSEAPASRKVKSTTTNESELVILHLSRLQVLFISVGLESPLYSFELALFFEKLHEAILTKKYSGKNHPERIYEYRMRGVPVLDDYILEEVCKSHISQEITPPSPEAPASRKVKPTTISTSNFQAECLTDLIGNLLGFGIVFGALLVYNYFFSS